MERHGYLRMKIGIDIGGTTVSAGLVDENAGIVLKHKIETRSYQKPETVICRIGDMVQSLLDEAKADAENLAHIGIGCAGLIDRTSGEVIYSNNIGWHHVRLGEMLGGRFSCKVYVDNDAICATLGEFVAGAGREADSMVMITIGTGIGGGLVLNNRLYHGTNGAAGILGHMVIKKDGIPCNCGRKGCFEVYASTNALIREAEAAAERCPDSVLTRLKEINGRLDGVTIFQAIAEEDACALEVFDTYTSDLASGIGNLINIFNPQIFVIGGGLSGEGERLLEPIRKKVKAQIYCGRLAMPKIRAAMLRNDAGIVGAAALADYQ